MWLIEPRRHWGVLGAPIRAANVFRHRRSATPVPRTYLLGAADELRTELGGNLTGLELAQHERALSILFASLVPEALAAALDVGRKLSLEDAAALVGQTGSIRPVSTP